MGKRLPNDDNNDDATKILLVIEKLHLQVVCNCTACKCFYTSASESEKEVFEIKSSELLKFDIDSIKSSPNQLVQLQQNSSTNKSPNKFTSQIFPASHSYSNAALGLCVPHPSLFFSLPLVLLATSAFSRSFHSFGM